MVNPSIADAIFANCRFVHAGALLDDRHRPPHAAQRLEIAQQHHGIGKIGHIDRRLHIADQSMLRHRHECRRALAVQILQQFMHVQDQGVFLGHGGLIAVEAVDHDGLDLVLIDPLANAMGEFAGRQLRGIDLLDEQAAARAASASRSMPSPFMRRKQQPEFLVEHEQRRLFAARDRRDNEGDRDQRLAGSRRPEDQRARSRLDTAAQQPVEFGDAARHRGALNGPAKFRGHQPRKDIHPAGGDGRVMIAAAKLHAAIFHDAHAPSLGAVGRRQLLQPHHAMRDAVHGLVRQLRPSDRRAA